MTYRDHAGIVGGNRVISVPCGEKIFSCPVSKNCHISRQGPVITPRAEKYYFIHPVRRKFRPLTTALMILRELHGNLANGSNYFEQDEEEEEEVVFRPAFSRVRSNSPASQLSCSLRGIQSQSSFGDLLLGSSTDAARTWPGVDGYAERTIFSNIIDTTFALLDDSAEPERNNPYSYQSQHSSNSFHVQPPPGFG